ncbi:MAG: bile acid:sodium symporter family protein [Dokdonella sp.]|nr:bile acid:sodium symporter [Dokdonella sp.]MCB1574237.1 bile acid:sodium symporter [Xanthomonadales bacterium]
MKRLVPSFDRYALALLATVALAAVLPCRGATAAAFDALSTIAIVLLFFLHGARLSRDAVIAGLVHWRLHMLVLAGTYLLFPLLGISIEALLPAALLPSGLVVGILFLCALPSTVQSSIAFTAIARGNVAAAVCSASLSNLLGVFLAPMLVSLLLHSSADGSSGPGSVGKIVLQLFVPFVAGHLVRPWIGRRVERSSRLLAYTDRGTVLLIVYVAFSASMVEGLWRLLPLSSLALLFGLLGGMLAIVLAATTLLSRRLGFSTADEIAIVFCGSKKSLASGVPIARILFAGNPALGMIVLPVLIYHQLQLLVCAVLAQRYARGSIQSPTRA